MRITFLGATKGVTGSSFLVEINNCKILIDCGMYQENNFEERNYSKFEYIPSEIDYLFLTHAHLDHCGLIPKLVNNGFKGKIFCSYQTLELVKIILYDSAKIQELNQRINNTDVNRGMLYNSLDVDNALSKFTSIELMEDIKVDNELTIKLLPVGHILGAASILLNIGGKTILFSGDIGRVNQSIIKSFVEYDFSNVKPDYIIMESLYAGKTHENKDENIKILIESINKIYKTKGKLLMPVFAMHRAQEMLEIINLLIKSKILNTNFDIYLDSPMAIEICKIYLNNLNEFNTQSTILDKRVEYTNDNKNSFANNQNLVIFQADRFMPDNLKNILKQKKSKKLINASNAVIMAGSGMADGGRIVKHLYKGLERPENVLLLVGFQAEDTLGRKLANGEKRVTIMDKEINVLADVKYLRGFSAHADENDLILWLNKFDKGNLKKVFLVHAEEESLEIFSKKLSDINIENCIPSYCDVVDGL
jgi:metallo-beta-lactamase family protein